MIVQIAANNSVVYGLDENGDLYQFNAMLQDWERLSKILTLIIPELNGEQG